MSSPKGSEFPMRRKRRVSAMLFLRSCTARWGQAAQSTASMRTTITKVADDTGGGDRASRPWAACSKPWEATSCSKPLWPARQSTRRARARQALSTDLRSLADRRPLRRATESPTRGNSSGPRLWQQLAAMVRAARWALIEKKSRYVRQADTPRACRMALLCRRDSISSAVNDCSATSMH
uniref:Uncharacterized protein n=1 Tax=Ixodes ricinus TaxID=34613 RepID=A0A6B0V1A2_IXORI